jgi:hypothetical protein
MGTFSRQVKRLATPGRTTAQPPPDCRERTSSLCDELCPAQAGSIMPADSCGNAVSSRRIFLGYGLADER